MTKKYFTVEEANDLLPAVETEVTILQELKHTFEQKYQQLQTMKHYQQHQGKAVEEDPAVFKTECQLEFLELEAQTYVHNIEAIGAELKDIDMGLVDFPAHIDGEEVLLCWKKGEAEITHYHGVYEGFSGRKPL